MKKRFFGFSTSQMIIIGFFLVVMLGSLLLALPISSATGQAVPYVDALFTATSATCVTGLVTLPTVTTWSAFGQAVLLVLIQIGGLGVVTIMSGLMLLLQRKMGLSDRLLIQDSFNLNTLSGLAKFIKRVILGTFLIEGLGALLYLPAFVPRYGVRGIWISVFNAVSAYCNAGLDIIATDSLCQYRSDPLVNGVTCLLIVLGGIGFIVWWDVIRVVKGAKSKRWRGLKNLTLHSKIALTSTAFLILGGAIAFFLFEFHNPLTMQGLSLGEKVQASFFQSVTTRTAGFATLPQQDLSTPSAIVSILLMFIGGSPAGTAGGIKTVTVVVLIASTLATIRNKNEVSLFHRNIAKQAVNKAVAVFCMSFFIMFSATVLLAAVTDAAAFDLFYETVSATATVGLSRDLTASMNTIGKIVLTFTMFFGRIGPISLAVAFRTRKEPNNRIKNPTEEISVG